MNLSELQSDYAQKKIITYASDHNTAVEKKLPIQQVYGNLYKGKDKKDTRAFVMSVTKTFKEVAQ